ncbi:hypothetical protein P7C70_g4438, partial [Phenoliferia sp. Uapishka_3]
MGSTTKHGHLAPTLAFSSTDSSSDDPVYTPPHLAHSHPKLQPLPLALSIDDEANWSSSSESASSNQQVTSPPSALGLSIPSPTTTSTFPRHNRAQLHPTSTPFSRPGSAVTVPFPPSRPNSALPAEAHHQNGRPAPAPRPTQPTPSSPQRTRRLSKRSSIPTSRGNGPTDGGALRRRETSGGRDREEDTRDTKGKGKERGIPRDYSSHQPHSNNDPLDPLSSVHHPPHPPPPTQPESGAHSRPHPAVPDHHQPSKYPSSDSIASTSKISSTKNSSNGQPVVEAKPPAPEQQSLQQILQSVDLSAALLLVQTIQSQQKASAAATPAISPTPSSLSVPHAAPPPRELPPRATTRSHATGLSHATSGLSLSSIDPQTPLLSSTPNDPTAHFSEEPSKLRPASFAGPPATALNNVGKEEKMARRRTLSLSFGSGNGPMGIGKRPERKASGLRESKGGVETMKEKERERVPDERAALPEFARAFEADISKVHLTLSPATMRRAQNCAKYLSMRYTPVYEALATNTPPPNLIEVAKYREKREDSDRQMRRAKVGASPGGGNRPRPFASREDVASTDGGGEGRKSGEYGRSEAGSSLNGRLSTAQMGIPTSVFGPKRNKHPKAWEVYPDHLEEFVESQKAAAKDPLVDVSTGGNGYGGGHAADVSGSTDDRSSLQLHPTGSQLTAGSNSERARSISYDHSLLGSPMREKPGAGYFPRPSKSRENSYEGSPLGRSSRVSLDLPPSSNGGLRRAGSLGSAPPTAGGYHTPTSTPRSNFASLSTTNSNLQESVGGSSGLQRAFSPRSTSRGELSEPPSPQPPFTSPQAPMNSPPLSTSPGTATSQVHHRHSQSDGLRGNVYGGLSRVVNKVRGKATDVDSSTDIGARRNGSTRRNGGWTGQESATDLGLSPDPSDIEASTGFRYPRLQMSENSSTLKPRKSPNSHNLTDVEGYRSSGDDRQGVLNVLGIRRSRKKGRGTDKEDNGLLKINYGVPREGERLKAPTVVRQPFYDEDSEEEEMERPKEFIDLTDEDFLRLNNALRQLRGEIAHVDAVLPRVPGMLNSFLEEITRHESETLSTVGIAVNYTYPRFSASVVSKLAYDKELALAYAAEEAEEDEASISTSSGSSDEDEGFSESDRLPRSKHSGGVDSKASRRSSTGRPIPRRNRSDRSGHFRRVTDPVSRGAPTTRMRSQTVAGPQDRTRLAHPSGREIDPLDMLKKAIEDLNRTTKDIDEAAERVGRMQDRVGKEIREVVAAVDEVDKAIEGTYLQQLRMLEDHFFRLRTSLTRPSTSIDLFWAGLSYFLTALFWLSWFLVTLFRIFRKVVTFPIVVIRWLFFLR